MRSRPRRAPYEVMRLPMRIVIGLVVLLAFIWTEWTGVSGLFVGSTRGAVVQSALATRTVKRSGT